LHASILLFSIEAENDRKIHFASFSRPPFIFIYHPEFLNFIRISILIACIHTLTCPPRPRLNATLAEFVVPGLNGHDRTLELSLKPASATN
jgi:hypothetical protein